MDANFCGNFRHDFKYELTVTWEIMECKAFEC